MQWLYCKTPVKPFPSILWWESCPKERGYKEAGVYSNGQTDTGIGGGICQVSSTLFNAALESNMVITARRAHSLPVSYLPRGRDAAVSWVVRNLSLRIRINFRS